MELSALNQLLELAGGPAFAVGDGVICASTQEAEALGIKIGTRLSELLPETVLHSPGADSSEALIVLGPRSWRLRSMWTDGRAVCFLRPDQDTIPGPNESTLIHTAGNIRAALQELTIALNALHEKLPPEDPAAAQCEALGLRSVYRLRRTAGDLELFSRLYAGTYHLSRQKCSVVTEMAAFCGETAELLRAAGIDLCWKLPARDFPACLDWPLITALLRELVANAAANSEDRRLELTLTRVGLNKLRFTLNNRNTEELPERPFHRHAEQNGLLRGGVGLGLSLVSAGAATHGGRLLLSADENGTVTALLSVTAADEPDDHARTMIQLPTGPDAGLVAFSTILPVETYQAEDLL